MTAITIDQGGLFTVVPGILGQPDEIIDNEPEVTVTEFTGLRSDAEPSGAVMAIISEYEAACLLDALDRARPLLVDRFGHEERTAAESARRKLASLGRGAFEVYTIREQS